MINKLRNAIQEILNENFSGAKTEIKDTHYSIQFACPYCMDSQVSERKKRGHLYLDSMRFNCYNCGTNKNMFSFLSDFGKISDFDYDELDKIDIEIRQHAEDFNRIRESVNMDVLFNASLINKVAIGRSKLKKHFGLVEVNGTIAEKYLKGRGQTDLTHFLYSKEYNSIWLLNQTSTNKIVGAQMRPMGRSLNKYFTFSLVELYNQLKLTVDDEIKKLEKLSLIFNIFRVDLSKQVLILEGPFDAFLLNNAIATLGSKKSLPFAFDNMIFIDDYDRDGYKKSTKMMDEGFRIFLWEKFLEDHKELKLNTNKKIDITDVIVASRKFGHPIKSLNNYFSNDMYDLYYL